MTRKLMAAVMLAVLVVAPCAFAGGSGNEGAATFKAKCAMCHGADGKGQTTMGKSMKLRDLGSAEVQKQTDAQLVAWITDGKGKMPAYKSKLTAPEIEAVVEFIRTLKK